MRYLRRLIRNPVISHPMSNSPDPESRHIPSTSSRPGSLHIIGAGDAQNAQRMLNNGLACGQYIESFAMNTTIVNHVIGFIK